MRLSNFFSQPLNMRQSCRILIFLGAFTAPFFLSLPVVQAALVGEAELGYVDYKADVNGARSMDASSFRQRYSLLYSKSDLLANDRLGRYRIALGYEWAAVDSKVRHYSGLQSSQESYTVSDGHVLFRGDLILSPQQLPIKIRAFSQDLTRANFATIGYTSDRLIEPGITDAIMGGTHIESGFLAEIGTKDTMVQTVPSIFAQMPRLYIDYRDTIVKELKTEYAVDTRTKKLSFVSLNKKDNWFHVRTTDYTDNLQPNNSSRETQVILGTIDQFMERRWVDFSNWIKLSADGQFIKHNEFSNNYEYYELNLFGIASRSSWEARSFNTFRRTLDRNGLTYDTKIPFYLSGYAGPDTDWRVRVSTEQSKVKLIQNYDATDTLVSYRIDTLKRGLFTLGHTGTVENYEHTDLGKTLSLSGRLEFASTKRFSSTFGLIGSYDIISANNKPVNRQEFRSTTQVFDVKGVYTPSNSWKFELDSAVTMASGNSSKDLTTQSYSNQASVVGTGVSTFTVPDDSYTRFRTMAKADWQPVARLKVSFSVTDDLLQAQGKKTEHGTEYANRIDYTEQRYRASLTSTYTTSTLTSGSATGFSSIGNLSYSPDRSLDSSVSYFYGDMNDRDGSKYSGFTLRQNTNYYLYTDYGVTRRILELNQALEYEGQDYSTGIRRTTKSLIGGFRYYPISRLFIAGRAKYSLLTREVDSTQIIYNATLGMTFKLFQATIDYSLGRENGNSNRLEKRFEANLKKVF
jgi:hypothetical protein